MPKTPKRPPRQPPLDTTTPREEFRLHGVVRAVDGRPLPGLAVRAFDKDLRTESLLGESPTDAREGSYSISYKREQFTSAEKASADLVVRVYQIGTEKPVFETPVIFNAAPDLRVDITLDFRDELSEFERYVREVTPLLEQLSLGKLDDEQRHFLSREAGLPRDHVDALSAAHRLARREVPAEGFYGLLRHGLPTDLPALVSTPQRVLRDALTQSIDKGIVPERVRPAIDGIVKALRGLAGSEILGAGRKRTRLGRLLDAAGLSNAVQQKVVETYTDAERPLRDVGAALADVPELRGEPLERLELSSFLALLTGDNLPLIERAVKRVRALDDLADIDEADWTALVHDDSGKPDLPDDVPGNTDAERVRNYVTDIRRALEVAVPMTFIRRGIARDTSVDTAHQQLLGRFFALAPDFDFNTSHVDRTIAQHATAIGDAGQ